MISELDLLLRALASRTRLRILARLLRLPRLPLHRGGGVQPKRLAAELHLTRSVVSHHLRVLLRLHLVRYWKEHTDKYYGMARVRRGSLRSRLLERLGDALPKTLPPVFSQPAPKPQRGRVGRPRPARHGEERAPQLQELWTDLTCYSHFRRVLMLNFLLRHGSASVKTLSEVADIAPLTVDYHLDKLLRRGEIVPGGKGYALVDPGPRPLRGLVHRTVGSTPLPAPRGDREL